MTKKSHALLITLFYKGNKMKTLFKYSLGLLGISLLIFFYFIKTSIGHKELESLIESYLSKETNNKIAIQSLNLEQYPNIFVTLKINDTTKVMLQGEIDKSSIDMNYHLIGKHLQINNFYLKDNVDVKGRIKGDFNHLNITGKGKIFEGNIAYAFINLPKKIENMSLQIRDANAKKIAHFFEQELPIEGLANIDATFRTLSNYEKKGQAKIDIKELLLPTIRIPFKLKSTISFDNIKYRYNIKLSSNIGEATVSKGHYNSSKKLFQADYHLYINNLSPFQKLLQHEFKGTLDAKGNLFYNRENQKLIVKGVTHKFGGRTRYLYKSQTLDLKLKNVPLSPLLKTFGYPILFTSKIYGNLTYRFKEKMLIVNADLKRTRFVQSKLTQLIQKELRTNLLRGYYNRSTFYAGYQNHTFSSTLRLDNGYNYIYLTDSTIDTTNNRLKSKFEIKMSGRMVKGNIYNTLDNPKAEIETKFFRLPNENLDRWFKNQIR
jgi:hypothetical protein